MGFGNNPFVPKARVAEQKARDAGDASAREQAWRDAARLWERAGEREMDAKRRAEYEQNALRARAQADGDEDPTADDAPPAPKAASAPARTGNTVAKPN